MGDKVDILNPQVVRFHRNIWIPDDAINSSVQAMRNSIKEGKKKEDLPNVFIYPIVVDLDSSSQTGETALKNLVAFNTYGVLTDKQLEATFEFLRTNPNWKNCFMRASHMGEIYKEEDFPIFVPIPNVSLILYFAEKIREEMFKQHCREGSEVSKLLSPIDKKTSSLVDTSI